MATTFKNGIHVIFVLLLFVLLEGRKHHLKIEKDSRKVFTLSSFGFYSGGKLEIGVTNFTLAPSNTKNFVGFSLEKTVRDKFNLDHHEEKCILNVMEPNAALSDEEMVIFVIDISSKVLHISKIGKSLSSIVIFSSSPDVSSRKKRKSPNTPNVMAEKIKSIMNTTKHIASSSTVSTASSTISTSAMAAGEFNISYNGTAGVKQEKEKMVKNATKVAFPIIVDDIGFASFNFVVSINKPNEEGLYNFYFHHCFNGDKTAVVNFSIDVTEENAGNYLSAGEMPLPTLYFSMSTLFFLSGCAWLYILRKSKSNDVFKLHYLMLVLVYVKSTSMLFHGMNFHFIQKEGFHIEAWAVLYYVTHLLKGTLLFITLVLIGTGWAFIKSILSDRDKKIFIVVLSLQVLANVALIIMEESEAGDSQYITWNEICILVDLLCCGAILFPVVWSIRHLQEASQVDGKAAISLRKLEVFRHFYIMIVCYIYFTRIIVYLLRITVPFQYIWLESLFKEFGTLIFFILTGYKFRPASNNPYLQVPQEEDEIEMEEVLTKTHITENLTKVVQHSHVDDASSKQESSHEYD